jgi:hypothetical protein
MDRSAQVLETAGGINLSTPSAAGSRKHQVDQNDVDILTCSDDGKVTFYLGCDRLGDCRNWRAVSPAPVRMI